jgi:hypothetical protein
MASFIDPQNGDLATAEHVAQLVEDFQGLRNIPISLSGINDAATYALTLKNAGTGSRDLIAYAADGTTVLLQVDATGVTLGSVPPGSISGTAIAAGSITNAQLGPDVARANLLTNGGLEIWSRGLGPFSNTFAADRWLLSPGAGSTMSGTRIAGNGGGFALQVVYTHSTASGISQDIMASENPVLPGKVVSFSADVNASAAGAAQLKILTNGAGAINVVSSFHPGGSTWQRLTVTATTNAATTDVQVSLALSASGTFQIDNAMLVVGSQAANYVPMHPADDLARCLRYYEVIGTTPNEIVAQAYGVTAGAYSVYYALKARKAITPTFTKNGTWVVTNCGQPAVVSGSVDQVSLVVTVTATGQLVFTNNAAGANVSVEANP